jgi:hypothetical protein
MVITSRWLVRESRLTKWTTDPRMASAKRQSAARTLVTDFSLRTVASKLYTSLRKLSAYQGAEAIQRRDAGETLASIAKSTRWIYPWSVGYERMIERY